MPPTRPQAFGEMQGTNNGLVAFQALLSLSCLENPHLRHLVKVSFHLSLYLEKRLPVRPENLWPQVIMKFMLKNGAHPLKTTLVRWGSCVGEIRS